MSLVDQDQQTHAVYQSRKFYTQADGCFMITAVPAAGQTELCNLLCADFG